MKKFLLHIICFAALAFVLALLADIGWSYKARHNVNMRMFEGWHDVYQDTTHYDVLISGSSRALVQYDPLILDSILGCNCYNLGMDGSSINREIIKYDAFCENHGYPDVLIQNIDLFLLRCTRGYEREQFYPYFYTHPDLFEKVNTYEHYSFADRFIPLYKWRGWRDAYEYFIIRDNTPAMIKGYWPQEDIWDGTELRAKDSIAFEREAAAMDLFEAFITQQKEKGVQVVLVYAPIYAEVKAKCPEWDVMYQYYGGVAEKYNVPILDYNDDELCSDTTYFYNGMHLNKNGAELFSAKLAFNIDSMKILHQKSE